jgi:hypothetical protein
MSRAIPLLPTVPSWHAPGQLHLYIPYMIRTVGRDNAVGITTRYGLDSPGIESRLGGEIFRTCPDRSLGPPSLYNGYRVFPRGKAAGGWH